MSRAELIAGLVGIAVWVAAVVAIVMNERAMRKEAESLDAKRALLRSDPSP